MFLNFSENVYIYPEIDGYFGDLAFSNLHTIPKQLTFFLNETNISASACCTIDLETEQPRKKKCLYIVWDCNFCMHVNTCLLAWWCGFFLCCLLGTVDHENGTVHQENWAKLLVILKKNPLRWASAVDKLLTLLFAVLFIFCLLFWMCFVFNYCL